jgi:hypothetical protein
MASLSVSTRHCSLFDSCVVVVVILLSKSLVSFQWFVCVETAAINPIEHKKQTEDEMEKGFALKQAQDKRYCDCDHTQTQLTLVRSDSHSANERLVVTSRINQMAKRHKAQLATNRRQVLPQ